MRKFRPSEVSAFAHTCVGQSGLAPVPRHISGLICLAPAVAAQVFGDGEEINGYKGLEVHIWIALRGGHCW
jgi:hypothetical protein